MRGLCTNPSQAEGPAEQTNSGGAVRPGYGCSREGKGSLQEKEKKELKEGKGPDCTTIQVIARLGQK